MGKKIPEDVKQTIADYKEQATLPVDATNDINEGLTPYDVSAMPKTDYPQADDPDGLNDANQKLAATTPSWLDAYFIEKGPQHGHYIQLVRRFNEVALGNAIMEIDTLISFPVLPDGAIYQPGTGSWRVFRTKNSGSEYLDSRVTEVVTPWGVYEDRQVSKTSRYVLRTVSQPNLHGNPFEESDPAKVAFKNGTYNIDTGEIEGKSPDNYILSAHNYDLDTSGTSTPEIESLLEEMLGDAATFFMEWIGYGFYRSYNIFNYMVFILGAGGEGKSTLLRYITQRIYGADNVAAVTPAELANPQLRFKPSELYGKDADIVADIGADFLRKPDTLKKLTGGDALSAEFKGGQGFTFTSYAKLLFSANELPTFSDDSKGMQRRLIVLELQNGDTRGTDFWTRHNMDKVLAERSAFAYKCLRMFADAKKRHKLLLTPQMEAASNEWIKANDHFGQFLDEACEIGTAIAGGESSQVVTTEYAAFCRQNNYSDKTTTQTITNKLKARGVEKIKGTRGFDEQNNINRYMGLKLIKSFISPSRI
ncbi:phage/plasmid primase, P4 family [Levilactobacillus lanxiensis]|uniref:Phage/plasmid primase, P4 family n=1 Tax=Levilactobacillus lanxiensis TaxID=2799568 RepID=A0ABW4D5R9_9LACO|nr:phage/plasmid primase, P4 family [Levilactobacillus lanxiensis]